MPSRGIPEIVRRKVELQSMSQQGQEWKSGSRRHVPELVELDQLMNDEEEDDGQEDIDGSEVFRKDSCVNRHDIRGSTRVSRNGDATNTRWSCTVLRRSADHHGKPKQWEAI